MGPEILASLASKAADTTLGIIGNNIQSRYQNQIALGQQKRVNELNTQASSSLCPPPPDSLVPKIPTVPFTGCILPPPRRTAPMIP